MDSRGDFGMRDVRWEMRPLLQNILQLEKEKRNRKVWPGFLQNEIKKHYLGDEPKIPFQSIARLRVEDPEIGVKKKPNGD